MNGDLVKTCFSKILFFIGRCVVFYHRCEGFHCCNPLQCRIFCCCKFKKVITSPHQQKWLKQTWINFCGFFTTTQIPHTNINSWAFSYSHWPHNNQLQNTLCNIVKYIKMILKLTQGWCFAISLTASEFELEIIIAATPINWSRFPGICAASKSSKFWVSSSLKLKIGRSLGAFIFSLSVGCQ